MTTVRRVVEATDYPITLTEAKLFCRVTNTAEDALITAMIKSATVDCENKIQRALKSQTWELVTDAFTDEIELPHPPVQSIVSIAYVDADDADQTVDLADVYLSSEEPAILTVAGDFTWPTTNLAANAVVIRYIAGYQQSPDLLPEPIKTWILMRVNTFYENRGEYVIGHSVASLDFIDGLLDQYKIHTLA